MFDLTKIQLAHSAKEAVALLVADPKARLIAGGTDVLIKLRDFAPGYANLVSIHNLPELKNIELLPNATVRLGAGCTFTELMSSSLVQEKLPMLAQAAASVAGPQIRNVGTLGGNLCNGAVSADTCAPVLAFNAQLNILGSQGLRQASIHGFHTGPGKVDLKSDEILLSVDIDLANYQDCKNYYYKYAMRDAMDIATITCAGNIKQEAGKITYLALAYGVAAPIPIRCPKAEQLAIGQELTPELFTAIAEAVAKEVQPRSSWRASAEFRLHIIKTLAQEVITKALGANYAHN